MSLELIQQSDYFEDIPITHGLVTGIEAGSIRIRRTTARERLDLRSEIIAAPVKMKHPGGKPKTPFELLKDEEDRTQKFGRMLIEKMFVSVSYDGNTYPASSLDFDLLPPQLLEFIGDVINGINGEGEDEAGEALRTWRESSSEEKAPEQLHGTSEM